MRTKEEIKKYNREYYIKNCEKLKEYQKPINRDNHLRRRYGIGTAQYSEMVADQDGKCLICGKVEKLCVDHCHTTGDIRGLLCINCNTGIGMLEDNFNIVSRAAKYLEGK